MPPKPPWRYPPSKSDVTTTACTISDTPWINHLCEDDCPLGLDGTAFKQHDGASICPLVVSPESQMDAGEILELPSNHAIRGCLRCTLTMTVQEGDREYSDPSPTTATVSTAGGETIRWSPDRDLHMTVVDAGASVTAIRLATVLRYTTRPNIVPLSGNLRFRTAKSGKDNTIHSLNLNMACKFACNMRLACNMQIWYVANLFV